MINRNQANAQWRKSHIQKARKFHGIVTYFWPTPSLVLYAFGEEVAQSPALLQTRERRVELIFHVLTCLRATWWIDFCHLNWSLDGQKWYGSDLKLRKVIRSSEYSSWKPQGDYRPIDPKIRRLLVGENNLTAPKKKPQWDSGKLRHIKVDYMWGNWRKRAQGKYRLRKGLLRLGLPGPIPRTKIYPAN